MENWDGRQVEMKRFPCFKGIEKNGLFNVKKSQIVEVCYSKESTS